MAMIAVLIVPATPAAAQELCMGMPATKVGTEGNDFLLGTEGVDVIVGLGGNDIIRGLGGDDYLCGGNGRDRLFGGFGNDYLEGGKKNDIVKGDQGKDTLFGNQGNDRLFGGPGADVLEGGSGTRDKLFGKGSMDTCNDPQGATIYDTCELGDAAPKLGSTVSLTTSSGVAADVTVHRVLESPTVTNPFWQPAAGHRFVSVLVTFESVAGYQSGCSVLSFRLRTSTGAVEEQTVGLLLEGAWLSSCAVVAEGDQVSGWVTFELRNGVQPTHLETKTGTAVSWDLQSGSPTSPTGEALAGEAALGSSAEYLSVENFTVTANQVVDPATAANTSSRPIAGNRLVAVQVSIRNNGDSPERVYRPRGDLKVVTRTGSRHTPTEHLSTAGAPIPFAQVAPCGSCLAPGATTSGWVVYEIPIGEPVLRIDLLRFSQSTSASWSVP
ncbi:MAG: DUF4352 domain-containing protein [Acidimicrobiales bacterium]|nr:DUF4352 domain-containing protein [Acidimicrobiales bacterium]